MTTNNKISNLINSQVPFFVRNDHQNFVRFLEAYYEFLEQNGGLVDRSKNLRSYQDIDRSLGDFEQQLYNTYLKLIPDNVIVDKRLLLKNVKDFYQSRGSEKSIRFLLNILYGDEKVEFYYPKKDVLRASDGKWYVQRSLRLSNLQVNGVANTSLLGLNKFVNRSIRGNTSNATATVDRIDRFFEKGTRVDELSLINILGDFVNGEQIFSVFDDEGGIKPVTANVFGTGLGSIVVTNGGSNYLIGQHPIVESDTGTGANVRIDRVSTGNIAFIAVTEGGAGYQNNSYTLITGGGGSGANAQVSLVEDDNSVHPNSYNIAFSTIALEANTPINNTIYSNLNTSIVASPNANTALVRALQFFVYGNTGPIRLISVRNGGTNFSSIPTISPIANNRIKELQVLGSMRIVNGGVGYTVGDTIEFINPIGGYGSGAAANVTNVEANGRIAEVRFVPVSGQITGGTGYNELPSANVVSNTGSGAIITVTNRLGEGGTFIVANSTLGSVEKITIVERGTGYTSIPSINLMSLGDGTAAANATIIEGVFTYPGRYLNDDGFLSSYNFLQDRDYYQEFSYVLRLRESIANYRKAIKDLVHPSGMKLFGAYIFEDQSEDKNFSEGGEAVISSSVPIPRLALDFSTGNLDSNITFTRTSSGSYVNSRGYIAYAGVNAPRFGHDTISLRPLGLLVEAQRTNLLTYSQNLRNTIWTTINVSVVANASVSPDGTNSAFMLRSSISGGVNDCFIQAVPSVSSNTNYTFSVFLKAGTSPRTTVNFFRVSPFAQAVCTVTWANNDPVLTSSGIIVNSSIIKIAEDWVRVSATINTAFATAVACRVYNRDQGTTNIINETSYIWGPQLEIGNVPTSYIPTGVSTVTRTADLAVVSGTNFSNVYNQTQGTVVVKGQTTPSTNTYPALFRVDDGTSGNTISIYYDGYSATPVIAAYTRNNFVQASSTGVNVATYKSVTSAISYNKTSNAGIFVANTVAGIFGSVNIGPTLNRLIIGRGDAELYGHVSYLNYYNTALSNTTLIQLTARP